MQVQGTPVASSIIGTFRIFLTDQYMWPSDALTSPLARFLIVGAFAMVLHAAPAEAQLKADLVVSGLTQPVAFVQDPSDTSVFVVVQQDGRIRAVRNGVLQTADFLDLRAVVLNAGEQGLLGLAFAPDYATSGRFYVNFVNLQGNTVIARFTRQAGDPLRGDPASRFDLQWPGGQRFITQPFSNHKGGNLAFGPDGFLYIGMGDGGSGNDPLALAQNPQSLLGKMLRIDVNVPATDPEGYDIPAANPFATRADVLPQIWSVGLRNPWRWSFDNVSRGGTGALVIGDVGQNDFEEIDYEPRNRGGRNYGWPQREGVHNNVPGTLFSPATDPIFEYGRTVGQSTTGGFVYRGTALGLGYRGRYFFADFSSSRVWSVALTVNPSTGEATASDLREHTSQFGAAATNPSSFGEDTGGELYIVSYAGRVYRIGSTEVAPSSPRKRPADSPIVGFAAPRSPVAPQHTAPVRSSVTVPEKTGPAAVARTGAPLSTPAPANATPRGRLFMHNGEWWIFAVSDTSWVLMPLREFLGLSCSCSFDVDGNVPPASLTKTNDAERGAREVTEHDREPDATGCQVVGGLQVRAEADRQSDL
jgi:glucose/arabinose dehydrogenase